MICTLYMTTCTNSCNICVMEATFDLHWCTFGTHDNWIHKVLSMQHGLHQIIQNLSKFSPLYDTNDFCSFCPIGFDAQGLLHWCSDFDVIKMCVRKKSNNFQLFGSYAHQIHYERINAHSIWTKLNYQWLFNFNY